MPLVYLVTSLPRLHFGEPAPLSCREWKERVRTSLIGDDLEEFERLALLDNIDETARRMAHAAADIDNTGRSLSADLRSDRVKANGDPPASELPDWVMMALPHHVLMRRWYAMLYERATSPFMQQWARFGLDLRECLTALLSRQAGLSKESLQSQMQGHFDSAAKLVMANYDAPDLGVGERFPWFERLKKAVDSDDLVEMELEVLRIRWERIEASKGTDPFALDTVLAAFLQLRILDRQTSWSLEKGRDVLADLIQIPPALEAWQTGGA